MSMHHCRKPSVSCEHQGLDRQQQRLDAKEHGVHDSDCVDRMKSDAPKEAYILRGQKFMVAGVSVRDASAARRHVIESAFVERLEKGEDCSWARHRLGVDQLLAATELAGGDVVLY